MSEDTIYCPNCGEPNPDIKDTDTFVLKWGCPKCMGVGYVEFCGNCYRSWFAPPKKTSGERLAGGMSE